MPTKSGNLDLFWKLSESKDNARIEAAFKIISNLHRGKNEEKEEFLEDFAYSLKRFVSGLASDRVNSRKGYFTVSFCLLLVALGAPSVSCAVRAVPPCRAVTHQNKNLDFRCFTGFGSITEVFPR